jgi:hypothetical protein
MATTVARLEAVLAADTRNFDRAMDRSHGKMSKVGKAAGVAGLAIFAGLGVLAKRGFDEISESQKVMAQTEAGIKSTGGAAKVTAKDITGLAERLSKLSGVDDEVIQQGENLLLTFRKVHNEVGAGNRIFDRATTAALDLSVRGFGSMDSTSKMLGKALEDPVRGMTALRRAGVTFTADQQAAIKAMVATGDTLGAQKAILKEVEVQVGGSAQAYGETLPGQMAKARNSFDEMAAKIMVAVLPALTKMMEKLSIAIDWLDRNRGAAKLLVVGLALLAGGMLALSIMQALVAVGAAVMWAALTAGLIVAIPALVAGFVLLWKKSETFRDIVNAIIGVMRVLWEIFLNVTPLGLIIKHFGTLSDVARDIYNWVNKIIGAVKDLINWLKKIKFPNIPGLGKEPVFGPGGMFEGDPRGGTGPTSISSKLYDELAGAQSFGLTLTSGYRPGAITRSGHPSDHGIYPSHAIDVAGPLARMAGFFRWLIGQRDVKQAFYDPIGSIFGGMLSSYREGGHSDHVHVATYGDGGIVKGPFGAEVPIMAHAGETILPTHKKNWKELAMQFMSNLWPWAAAYFPIGASMPRNYFPQPGTSAELFVGMTTDEPAGHRTMVWPKWINDWLFGGDKGWKSNAFMTILHEWAHAFQSKATLKDWRLAEGGATALARYAGPALASMLGLSWYSNPSLVGDPYAEAFRWVRKNKGMDWVLGGQFAPRIYDRGGWLPQGLSLAYNGTGGPERVGSGGTTFNLYAPNYVGDKRDLAAVFQNMAAEFKRRNGRDMV